jgi:hypothetical protein
MLARFDKVTDDLKILLGDTFTVIITKNPQKPSKFRGESCCARSIAGEHQICLTVPDYMLNITSCYFWDQVYNSDTSDID